MDIRLFNSIIAGVALLSVLALMVPRWRWSRSPRRMVWIALGYNMFNVVGGSLFLHTTGSNPSPWSPSVTAGIFLVFIAIYETRHDDKKRNPPMTDVTPDPTDEQDLED